MSASPLVTRIASLVNSDMIANNLPSIYAPTLEQIILYALTELSTDSAMDASAQSQLTTALSQAGADATP